MGMDWFADVLEFHRRLAPDRIGTTPAWPDADKLRLVNRLIREETRETKDAEDARDLPETVDGILDLIYVQLGKLVTLGVDPRDVWDAIHASNCRKSLTGRRGDGKVQKGDGWEPPDVAGILAKQPPLS